MPRDGSATRTNLLDAAEALILEQGFSATSVDQLIERVGITKGAFFYHFKTKADLARALVERYAESDAAHLTATLTRAEALSRDPLQQLLIFVGLFVEELSALTEPYPGCLFASYVYEAGLFDDDVHVVIRDSMLGARALVGAKLREAIAAHPPRGEIDVDTLADLFTVLFEGAFIVSKVLVEPQVTARQLALYRDYLERIFAAETGVAPLR
jgi:TetR/AcrR family transcriptional repressor of nem operon